MQDAMLAFELGRCSFLVPFKLGLKQCPVVWMNPAEPFAGTVFDFTLGVPQPDLPSGRLVNLSGQPVPVPETVVDSPGRQRVPLFALAKRFLGSLAL